MYYKPKIKAACWVHISTPWNQAGLTGGGGGNQNSSWNSLVLCCCLACKFWKSSCNDSHRILEGFYRNPTCGLIFISKNLRPVSPAVVRLASVPHPWKQSAKLFFYSFVFPEVRTNGQQFLERILFFTHSQPCGKEAPLLSFALLVCFL